MKRDEGFLDYRNHPYFLSESGPATVVILIMRV